MLVLSCTPAVVLTVAAVVPTVAPVAVGFAVVMVVMW